MPRFDASRSPLQATGRARQIVTLKGRDSSMIDSKFEYGRSLGAAVFAVSMMLAIPVGCALFALLINEVAS